MLVFLSKTLRYSTFGAGSVCSGEWIRVNSGHISVELTERAKASEQQQSELNGLIDYSLSILSSIINEDYCPERDHSMSFITSALHVHCPNRIDR